MTSLRLARVPSTDPNDVDGPFRQRRQAGAAWCRSAGLHEIFADIISAAPDNPFSVLEPVSKAGWTYATTGCICVRQAKVLDATAVMPTTVPMDKLPWGVACHDTPYRALDGMLPDGPETADMELVVHVAHGWHIRCDFARLLLKHDARIYVPLGPRPGLLGTKGAPLRLEVAGGVEGMLMPVAVEPEVVETFVEGFTPARAKG